MAEVMMKFFLKLTLSIFLSLSIGIGSAYAALWITAKSGAASRTSDNPYARAAFAARDLLPGGTYQ
jgi:hypothetical protein